MKNIIPSTDYETLYKIKDIIPVPNLLYLSGVEYNKYGMFLYYNLLNNEEGYILNTIINLMLNTNNIDYSKVNSTLIINLFSRFYLELDKSYKLILDETNKRILRSNKYVVLDNKDKLKTEDTIEDNEFYSQYKYLAKNNIKLNGLSYFQCWRIYVDLINDSLRKSIYEVMAYTDKKNLAKKIKPILQYIIWYEHLEEIFDEFDKS